MNTHSRSAYVVAFGVAALGFAVLVCVLAAIFWSPYPSTADNFSFSEFGFWGKSPADIIKIAHDSSDVGEIYAALDALALIGLHYENSPATTSRALDAIKEIHDLAQGRWSRQPNETTQEYGPFDPWHQHSREYDLTFGQSVECGVFTSVTSLRDVALHDDLPSLVANCDKFLVEIQPESDSPIHEVWRVNAQAVLRKAPEALKALKDAVESYETVEGTKGTDIKESSPVP